MQFNKEQKAVIEHMAHGQGNLLTIARAGTGKTTTIVAGAQGRSGALFCAFNRSSRDDIKARVDAEVKTCHQLGLRLAGARLRCKVPDDPESKGRDIAKDICRERRAFGFDYWVARAASLAKNLGFRRREGLIDVVEQSGAEFTKDFGPQDMEPLVFEALKRAKADTKWVDFDDMIWLPYIHRVRPTTQYPMVIVDELQDLSAPQSWIIDQTVAPSHLGGRVIGVGDDRQCIYKFRGAGEAVDHMRNRGCDELTMPVSYRCARSIVQMARRLVPDFRAMPGAPEGSIVTDRKLRAQPGEAVLSRWNAPLFGVAMRMLREGTPVCIAGKDLGTGLDQLVQRSKQKTTDDLVRWLEDYKRQQRQLLTNKEALEAKVDRADALAAAAQSCTSISELRADLKRLFQAPKGSHVRLSTVHRAKGLEWDCVHLLEYGFPALPPVLSEEHNIRYVAITRAKTELHLVGASIARLDPPARLVNVAFSLGSPLSSMHVLGDPEGHQQANLHAHDAADEHDNDDSDDSDEGFTFMED